MLRSFMFSKSVSNIYAKGLDAKVRKIKLNHGITTSIMILGLFLLNRPNATTCVASHVTKLDSHVPSCMNALTRLPHDVRTAVTGQNDAASIFIIAGGTCPVVILQS